jgi:glyoxylate reductase
MKPKILITNKVPEDHLEPLLGWTDIIYGPAGGSLMPREEVLRQDPALAAIINQAELKVDTELLERFPKLKIIASVSIGLDHLDIPLLNDRGIWASNVPDAFVGSAADCAMALLLNVARRIREADIYVRSGDWKRDGFQPGRWDGMNLEGKTLGLVGFGKIGQAVARRAEAFGMSILIHDPAHKGDPRHRDLDTLLAGSHVLSLHLPLLPTTRGLIDAKKLALLPPDAIVLNLARGGVLSDAALVDALKSGHLSGAGLDVFENEPTPHPELIAMPQVILTPHIGGGTRESRRQARLLCAENVARVLKGEKPVTPVNQPMAIGN